MRKGLWFPLPAFEFGAGAVDILGSHMYAMQGYAKIALQEGFHDWVLPSFAVRGSVSQLLGTSQVNMTVWGVDVLISKAFSIGGTARIEPYFGWNVLFIDARSGVIDATPGCDAYAQHLAGGRRRHAARQLRRRPTTEPGTTSATTSRSRRRTSSPATAGSVGAKLKLSVLFLAAEGDLIQARHQPRQQRRYRRQQRHAGELLAVGRPRLLSRGPRPGADRRPDELERALRSAGGRFEPALSGAA